MFGPFFGTQAPRHLEHLFAPCLCSDNPSMRKMWCAAVEIIPQNTLVRKKITSHVFGVWR